MAAEVIMPQMGESIAEGTITKWLKKVGDAVKRDEPIFEISTDKVDAEIPSPVAGTLLEIKVQEGQTVAINTVVGVIGEAGEKAAAAPAPAPAPARRRPKAAAARAGRAAAPAPSAEAEPAPRPAPAPARPRRPRRSRRRARPRPRRGDRADRSSRSRSASAGAPRPLVRKIAQEHAIEIGEIDGHRHPQPRDEERHPLLHREPQGRRRPPAAPPRPPTPPAPAVGRAEPRRGARAAAPRDLA